MADTKTRQTKPKAKRQTKAKAGRPSKARGAPMSSDAADARWTVRGVPSNIREIATKAAQNRGMTVGDWLAETIALSAKQWKISKVSPSFPSCLADPLADKTARQRSNISVYVVQ